MHLALVQFNPTIGALTGNADRIIALAREADEGGGGSGGSGGGGAGGGGGADATLFPELALTGYPPRDLLNQEGFVSSVRDEALRIARETAGLASVVILGTPWRPAATRGVPSEDPDSFDARAPLTNALLVIHRGRITHRYDKRLLPTYDVFDEHRYFMPGTRPVVLEIDGIRVGLSICEDLWKGVDVGPEITAYDRYDRDADPVADLVKAGARLILNPSGSPFVTGKRARQRDVVTRHVQRHNVAIATLNQVGANDDLIFDGHAAAYVPGPGPEHPPRLIGAGPGFAERIVRVEIPSDESRWAALPTVEDPLLAPDPSQEMFDALVIGVRDYIRKCGFSRAIIGLSGGIDSALTATIAAAALGAGNVLGVAMPSRHSSGHSVTDAAALARNLGLGYDEIPIETAHGAMEATMRPAYERLGMPVEEGVTEENVQSRLRGTILMALSNKSGAILLTTGNKSELAVGYCTLYGDMNGGLAVLSDVTKLEVYALSNWINANPAHAGFACPPIPRNTIDKPPSAELRADQLDSDSLPPYDQLDAIIERYVEMRQHPRNIVAETGLDAAMVARIVCLIDLNEYKRKQMPIGLKVSAVAFGRGRRRPLAQGYRPDRDVGGGGR